MTDAAELPALNERFAKAPAKDVLAWAFERFRGAVAISSSFGAESACLLSLAVQVQPDIPVIFINTGFHFPETLRFRDQLVERLQLNLREVGPAMGHAEFLKQFGRLYETDPDRCCAINKVEPLKRALDGLQCWISGVRGDQTLYRAGMEFVERKKDGLYKVSPLLGWSAKAVYEHMQAEQLPFHPLWEQGYSSIGCEPCTGVPGLPEDPRSGRWKGKNKSECGIHTFMDAPSDPSPQGPRPAP